MASYSLSAFKIRLINSILFENFNKDVPLDRVFANHFRKIKLEPQEQSLIIDLVNDLIKRLNYYSFIAGYNKPKDGKRHINKLICALHVENKWPVPKNLPECDDFSEKQAKIRKEQAKDIPNLRYGCPEWLDLLGRKELGDRWDKEKIALSRKPDRYIRVNTLKVTREQLCQMLTASKIKFQVCENQEDAIRITGNADLFKTQMFKDGFFEQQDCGSQEIAPYLQVKPGMRVVDACAGAGGKTLHISALMKGKGVIIAMDDKDWKLQALRERAKRAGAFNIETRHIDSPKVIKKLKEQADRVLLDVPCSGTGVLKRNFDTKWSDNSNDIRELTEIQADIIDRYSQMTKRGGILVYSTCSILPMENQNQIETFLKKHSDFVLDEQKTVYPSEGGDGFFMARMRRLTENELADINAISDSKEDGNNDTVSAELSEKNEAKSE
ncbi:RsmB/NOP family class I SAM-dependent RNA methyltransferase [Ruminobacter sp.]|uniref:RsmB/NOP family class I SAM-dependent RNA methyltransferase n=1 Tax=Ruminobacter sp. TaxID=2774296 RepID=UPI0038700BEC